jgi:aconitase A
MITAPFERIHRSNLISLRVRRVTTARAAT